MRTLLHSTVLAALVAAPALLQAQVRTLTFDAGDPIGGLATGAVLGSQYAAFGVTFAANALVGPSWATNTDLTVVSSTGGDVGGLGTPSLVSGNIIRSFDGWLSENGDPSLRATFSVNVDQVSIDLAGISDPGSTTIRLFNGATQIGSVAAAANGQQQLAFLAPMGQLITSVVITPGDFFDWVGFDNFTYRQVQPASVVPEPSTYVLLATGLASLGAVARRRRRQ